MRSLTILALSASVSLANATSIQVTVSAPGVLGLAPAYAVFHDGSFDIFEPGTAASSALEALAELGDTSGYSEPNGMTIAPGGPFMPGGGMASAMFDVDGSESYFSIASMVLPSNDWFIGNDSAFDISSLFSAAVGTSMTFDFTTIWNAGTEMEDFAYSAGNPLVGITTSADTPGGTTEGGVVSAVTGADPYAAFANLQPIDFDTMAIDPAGSVIGRVTLTVVPEPSTAALLGLGIAAFGMTLRRRH